VTDRRSASLSLKQLAYLLAVRDTLNFTRAAEQCFVTQSSLSGGLAELERNLGLKLVERSRQHVAMTAAGEAVCARAEQILSASEDLLAFARAQAEPGTGSLRLGIIPTIAPYLLHDFLAGTAEHFPALELFLHERQTENLLAEVSGGELDAAVLAQAVLDGQLFELGQAVGQLVLGRGVGDEHVAAGVDEKLRRTDATAETAQPHDHDSFACELHQL